jgi:transglutaminase-like putative cysteine protease
MLIRFGYEIVINCWSSTPIVTELSIEASRVPDVRVPEVFLTDPEIETSTYVDVFGNACRRFIAPPGDLLIRSDCVIEDSGNVDVISPEAEQVPVSHLPDGVLLFLMGSRYCETDRLSQIAWNLFGGTTPGWARVQAICDFVHQRIAFDYQSARSTRSAYEAYEEQVGVCRDFAHLSIALCRCMNIPARYVNGYLGDIGVPVRDPMDFSAWMEVYLGGRWWTFDARNNIPRIGRIVIARGRDAADVAMLTSFGSHILNRFTVWTFEVDTPSLDGPIR